MAVKKAKPRRIKAKSTVSRSKATKKLAPKLFREGAKSVEGAKMVEGAKSIEGAKSVIE